MRFLVPALGLVCLASSCTLNTDYFSEYRGVNLLGNYDFNAVESDGTTPKWKLATSSDFVRWERIGDPLSSDPARDTAASVPTVGPDGVSPVYRVEIKNLIPNGDFEDSAVTNDGDTLPKSFWRSEYYNGNTAVSTPIATFGQSFVSVQKPLVTGTITKRILGWEGAASGNHIVLDLYNAVTSVGLNPWSARRYVVRLDILNLSDKADIGLFPYATLSPAYQVVTATDLASSGGNWTVTTTDFPLAVHPVVNEIFTDTLRPNDEPRFLVVGAGSTSGGPYAAAVDNVRLVPGDQILGVKADFPSLASGVKPLLPGSKKGMYRFSVWVHNDPTAGTLNRFEPAELTIKLRARVKSGDPEFPSSPGLRPAVGWPTWTQLQFDMGFDFVNSDTDLNGNPALTLSIIPTNGTTGSPDAGSLLVSQPVLTFNP